MWVRHTADDGQTHQLPRKGETNYLTVRVKNRGLQRASNVSVEPFFSPPGTGLAFPDDWTAMDPARLPADDVVEPGGETVVGPFEFIAQAGHESLVASLTSSLLANHLICNVRKLVHKI